MKKHLLIFVLFVVIVGCAFSLSSCALAELANDKQNVVDMGGSEEFTRWNLVENNNLERLFLW